MAGRGRRSHPGAEWWASLRRRIPRLVEESRFIELKLALAASLKAERLRHDITQVELAKLRGTSQSRLAKMEAADPTVTVHLLQYRPRALSCLWSCPVSVDT
jgi:hypothetical protein